MEEPTRQSLKSVTLGTLEANEVWSKGKGTWMRVWPLGLAETLKATVEAGQPSHQPASQFLPLRGLNMHGGLDKNGPHIFEYLLLS